MASISIHVPRAGDDSVRREDKAGHPVISIHVPRAGDDSLGGNANISRVIISIHVPRAGDDKSKQKVVFLCLPFQSTSPVRGTTGLVDCFCHTILFISIHVPRAGDDRGVIQFGISVQDFNPRPPCGGRHAARNLAALISILFQSTSPVRGTTIDKHRRLIMLKSISIHVPRAGDDVFDVGWSRTIAPISIHVPRAGDDSKTVQFFRSLQHVLHYFLPIGSSNPILF